MGVQKANSTPGKLPQILRSFNRLVLNLLNLAQGLFIRVKRESGGVRIEGPPFGKLRKFNGGRGFVARSQVIAPSDGLNKMM
jgi:hypothetical protein